MNISKSLSPTPPLKATFIAACSAVLLAACSTPKPVNTTPTEQRFPSAAQSVQETAPAKPEPTRNIKIGLALGGGAARGFSHVGVIKALAAQGIKVDVVTGTSAGSMVAVLYASGMPPSQLQQAAMTMDEATLADWTLTSRGMIKGEALQNYMNAQLKNRTLDKLALPVGVIATDFDTGSAITFVRGNAGVAVRASASIPGVFSPTKIGNKTYVDGGLVSPVPAKAAKEMGADYVIAVDISARPGKAPEGLAATLNQTVSIMGQNIRNEELKQYADFVIHPNIDHISGTNFTARSTLITEGEKATMAAVQAIKQGIEQTKARLNLR